MSAPSLGLIKHQTRQMAALKETIKFVRKVIANNDFPQGFTTAELYKLATKEPAPPGFRHEVPELIPRRNTHTGFMNPVHMPERLDHPVRSMKYLKTMVLPVLEGSGEITMSTSQRTYTNTFGLPQNPPKKRRKGKQDPRVLVDASPEAPVTHSVWCWKKIPESSWNAAKQADAAKAKREAKGKEEPADGAEVGALENWGHLNVRRERARKKTIMKDITVQRVLDLEASGQLGESMALSSLPLSKRFLKIA